MDNGFTRALKGGAVQVNKDIDRREVPRYGIEEAARCLGMSAATLNSWVHGRKYPTSGGQKFFKPLIELIAPGNLSFYNLVEAHILLSTRKKHKVEMPAIRRAMDYVRKTYPSAHPLLSEDFDRRKRPFRQENRRSDGTRTDNQYLAMGAAGLGPILFLSLPDRARLQGVAHQALPDTDELAGRRNERSSQSSCHRPRRFFRQAGCKWNGCNGGSHFWPLQYRRRSREHRGGLRVEGVAN